MQVVDNSAYVTDAGSGSSGLEIIDISNPATPILLGSYDTYDRATAVQVVNNYAYVADDNLGLQIIDISTPTTPTLLGSYDTFGSARGVQVVGNYAYMADGVSGLLIVDISNPSIPMLLESYDTLGEAYGVQVVGNIETLSLETIAVFMIKPHSHPFRV